MRIRPALALSSVLCLAIFGLGHRTSFHQAADFHPAPAAECLDARGPLAVCFDAGTSPEYVAQWTRRLWNEHGLDYQIADRWSHTALQPSTGTQGDPVTLTYSFVPDGVMIDGQPSQLFSRMNELFNGNQALWQSKFAQVFERWSQLSGLSYQQVTDDGAAFGQSPGVVGVRGDCRIGSVNIDGPSNVLAYDYYPDIGDMVLDASENWGAGSQDYIFLRNIVAHEHGHGWGLAHVCPSNGTKLLEPYYSAAYNGPQHDDIRAAQRDYGDNYEPNDNAAAASPLGLLSTDSTLGDVSLDDNSDSDFYTFSVPAGKGFTLELSPVGHTYLDGPQNNDGSCTAGSQINSLDDQNLDLYLRDASGAVILAQSATHPVGESELIYRYQPPAQGGSYMVEVSGANANTIQLYQLQFGLFNLADPYLSVNPLNFDSTQLNDPVSLPVTLINPGPQAITINSITASGPFTVTPNGPEVLPPQGSLDLAVTYQAQSLGTQTGELTLAHSGPGGSIVCPLVGTSVTSSVQFLNGQTANFGEVPINTMDSTALAIRAQGNVPVGILNVITNLPFSIQLELPLLLNPTQSLILRPRFAPTELGNFDGYMVIVHTAQSSPDTVFLHGVGVPNLSSPEPSADLPAVYRLGQNYPNPFNPSTSIDFDLPRAAKVRLQVFNVQGQLVRELVNGELPAGRHAVTFDAASLPSGMYIYRINTPEFTDLRKMILMR